MKKQPNMVELQTALHKTEDIPKLDYLAEEAGLSRRKMAGRIIKEKLKGVVIKEGVYVTNKQQNGETSVLE